LLAQTLPTFAEEGFDDVTVFEYLASLSRFLCMLARISIVSALVPAVSQNGSLGRANGFLALGRANQGSVHPAYNPSFSACFFSQNSIFLSQQISQQYFSADLSAQPNGAQVSYACAGNEVM
jgi:hypothetical protein